MATKPTTILIADDHAVVRRGFSMILAAQLDMQVLSEVSTGREAEVGRAPVLTTVTS